jgi:hypothetical protein
MTYNDGTSIEVICQKDYEESMKKYILFLTLLQMPLFAQWNTSAIKLGAFVPSSAGSGFIVGYEGSHFFDPQFSFGWSIDWFHANYTDGKVVSDFNGIDPIPGTSGNINELRAKTNLHDFPIMAIATVRFPITPLSDFYAFGGLGAEALFVSYSNYNDPSKDDFKTAFDFNWRLGIGASYGFSKKSEVFGEIAYHSSAPSWNYQVTDISGFKHTYERIFDMSGMMFRLGLRFYY